jgi:hypothetical protein
MTLCDLDKIFKGLGTIQHMAENYENYLDIYDKGGKMPIESFMNIINTVAEDVRIHVEDDQCM